MPQIARYVLAITIVVTGVFLIFEARGSWFFIDEWDFLGFRGVHLGPQGLFYPHNEHWSTIPILIYRGFFNVVGVRDYWAYSLPLIATHLAVVYLLWRMMLRYEVNPWVATLLSGAFALQGVGAPDLTYAFNVSFVGSLAFGILAIRAIERDRTWIPALWCVCGLMCSDVGVAMVIASVLVALTLRRFKAAAVVAFIPGFVFLVWYASVGHEGGGTNLTNVSIGGLLSFLWTGLTSSFGGFLVASQYVGAVVIAVLAAAIWMKWNVPAALALTTVPYYLLIGLQRSNLGSMGAAASRYSYITIALTLPLVGQVVTRLVENHNLRPFVVTGLVVLIAANAVQLQRYAKFQAGFEQAEHSQLKAAAYLIHGGEHFPGQRTDSDLYGPPDMPSVKVLTAMVHSGEFPVPRHVSGSSLRAERALLETYTSQTRGYPANLVVNNLLPSGCSLANANDAVEISLERSTSADVMILGGRNASISVSFPATSRTRATSLVLTVDGVDHWLNLPAGIFPVVYITPSKALQLCAD